jgi:hypothetical protein
VPVPTPSLAILICQGRLPPHHVIAEGIQEGSPPDSVCCQCTIMSDESEAQSSSAPGSDTLSADGASLHSTSSTDSSTASSTTVCWTPSGLSGRLLHIFGPSTVDLVTRLTIKRRLSSISSQISVRSRKKSLSEVETESLGAAYRDLVELSS